MKIKIKNFAIFQKETTFELAPITLLIGGNSSGKSTFIKALDIARQLEFQSETFDIDSVKDYISNNTVFKLQISKNVFLKLDYSFHDFSFDDQSATWGDIDRKITYVDQKSREILSIESNHNRPNFTVSDIEPEKKSANIKLEQNKELTVSFDLEIFKNILIDFHESMGYTEEHYMSTFFSPIEGISWLKGNQKEKEKTRSHLFKLFNLSEKKGLLSQKISKNIRRNNLIQFEEKETLKNLFEERDHLIKEFLEIKNLNKEDEITLSEVISSLFEKNSSSFYQNINLRKSLEIIRWDNIGISKRMYTDQDPLKKVLDIISDTHDLSIHLTQKWFIDRWINKFFSQENCSYKINKIKNRRGDVVAYEFLLGGKDMVEWGTGAYRIINYIFKLAINLTSKTSNVQIGFSYDEYNEKGDEYVKNFMEGIRVWNDIFFSGPGPIQSFYHTNFLIIEEPEMNLHPDYQCLLAEMLYDFSVLTRCNVIIETHSEYMVRTFQYLRRKESFFFTRKHCCIINFGSGKKAGSVKNIRIEEDGSLSDSFYSGFLNHSQELELKLLAHNRKIGSN